MIQAGVMVFFIVIYLFQDELSEMVNGKEVDKYNQFKITNKKDKEL